MRARGCARLLALAALVVELLAGLPARPALAAGADTGDQIALAGLAAAPVAPLQDGGPVRFNAAVNYRLQSASRAFLLLLVFEDNAKTASQSEANADWVTTGSGQADLALTYQPRSTTKTMVVFAGLFSADKTLLAFSTTQPFPAQPAPGRGLFNAAMLARRAGQYATSVDDLTKAIQLAPNNGNYYYWRADDLVQLGQYDRAIADYNRALAIFPGNRATRVGRAIARMWEGNWAQAAAELTQVIDESPKADKWTVWALRARGIAHAELGQPAAAIADYQRYVSLTNDPSDQARVENWITDLGP